jgi:hypothetical protein
VSLIRDIEMRAEDAVSIVVGITLVLRPDVAKTICKYCALRLLSSDHSSTSR